METGQDYRALLDADPKIIATFVDLLKEDRESDDSEE